MHKLLLSGLGVIVCSVTPANAQFLESGAVRGFAAGLGGGAAAIQTSNAKVMANTPRLTPQQLSTAVTSLTNQGKAYDKSHNEQSAVKSYRDALRMIAQRDGVGSEASVPVLGLLVSSLESQKNYAEAISNQKTIVLFAKKNAAMAPMQVTTAQQKLADLYIANNDSKNAEIVLKDNLAFATSNSEVPAETRESLKQSLDNFSAAHQ